MATAYGQARERRSEEKFFLVMAWLMAATIVAGFALNLVLGRSTFAVPLVFHVHAFVFFGWVALYLAQTTLIAGEGLALHRRLGWLAVAWVPAMLVLGVIMTVVSLRTHGGPPFYDKREFLVGNPVGLLAFAALVAGAITLRRRTAWHRRLMLCGMALLTAPGLGRLLPTPLFIPYAWVVVNLATLVFPAFAMIADRRRHGHVHPALWWGVAVIVGTLAAGEAIAHSPVGSRLTSWVVEGTPGAARPVEAHFP